MGALLIVLSATPLPYGLYAVWSIPVLGTVIDPCPTTSAYKQPRLSISAAVIAISIAAGAVELPYHITSASAIRGASRVVIIADSITAGLGAVLFAVHPLTSEVAVWVLGRTDLLATLFLLWATWLHAAPGW